MTLHSDLPIYKVAYDLLALFFLVCAIGAADGDAYAKAGLYLIVSMGLAWFSCCTGGDE